MWDGQFIVPNSRIFWTSFIAPPYFRKPCWPQPWNQQQKQKVGSSQNKISTSVLLLFSSLYLQRQPKTEGWGSKAVLYAFQALCQWEIRENRDPIIHYIPRDWVVQVDAISSSCMLPLKRYPHSHMISCSANPIQYQKELSHTDSLRSLLFPPLLRLVSCRQVSGNPAWQKISSLLWGECERKEKLMEMLSKRHPNVLHNCLKI